MMLAERIKAGDFPSAVYLVAEKNHVAFADALGDAVRTVSDQRAATIETIYDLASLTKPLVTGLLTARRVERRALTLETKACDILPEFSRADKQTITLRHLLAHTSGLPAWRPLYLITDDPQSALQTIADEPLQSEPGAHVRYSDLGFITLGFLLERLTNFSLTQLATREIFVPLDLQRTFFNPDISYKEKIAASETGNLYERTTCGAIEREAMLTPDTGWREGLIHGQVHDGNAYFLGGAAGHAGLFSTAHDTLRLCMQFLAQSTQLLQPETCALFRTNLTIGMEEARSFAWQLAATKDSTAGASLPRHSFGHTGFTGTSCWIDPENERIFILLTNRTHDCAVPFININSVRRRFHTLAVAALCKARGDSQ
jgi:CubicO group peptidase (beta-lactamase class C family)